jgi:hypothetical protein
MSLNYYKEKPLTLSDAGRDEEVRPSSPRCAHAGECIGRRRPASHRGSAVAHTEDGGVDAAHGVGLLSVLPALEV